MAQENAFEGEATTPIYSEMRGFIAQQSIFSHDSCLLFLYSGNTIYIHSVATGECICSLKGHQSHIVSLLMNPSNHLQLISMDHCGTIKIWDYLRCTCVDTISVPSAIQLDSGAIYSSLTGCKPVTSCTKSMDKHLRVYCIVNQQHIIAISLTTKKIRPIIYNVAKRLDVKGKKESFQNLSISNDGSYLSAIMQREIIIIQLSDLEPRNLRILSYQTRGWKLSNSVAFHPNNELIAFGDQRGAIHLWHDFVSLFMNSSNWNLSFLQKNKHTSNVAASKKNAWQSVDEWLSSDHHKNAAKQKSDGIKKTQKKRSTTEQKYLIRKIHWHSHMVSSIAFTTDGAYMLSGGEESVLVLTQLETSRQQFLPRLGGPITHVSVSADEIKFAVCLKSNTIRIVDSINNKIIKTIEGIGICHQMEPEITHYHHPFSCNPRNMNCFALPSLPGTVQFYDLNKDKSRGTLKLVQYPLISRMQQKYPDRYVAEFMQFNLNGTRLITVIKRTTHSILGLNETDGDRCNEDEDIEMDNDETENLVNLVTLQIWHYNVSNNEFVLNTRIDAPHHSHSIRGIVFHPNKNRFVSFAHKDHNFKIWDECHVTKYLKPTQQSKALQTKFDAKQHVTWKSLMSGYYHKDAVSAAQFSNDGTVLFIAAGSMLTLWNASNLMLLKKMDQGCMVRRMDTFHHLPYLLTVNEAQDVTIWDLVQFKKHWSVKQVLNVKRILDVSIIPFKHRGSLGNSLFLMACELDNDDSKYLILCDMQNKKMVHQWILPKAMDIKENSMIIQPHAANKQVLKQIVRSMKRSEEERNMCDKDIDVVFVTNKGAVRIPCLYTQWKHKSFTKKDIEIVSGNDNNNSNDDSDAVTKYLEKLSGNHSIFERIFGSTLGLESKPVNKEELERQKESTRQRLAKLTPDARAKSSVVDDMFCGPAHTLPPIDDMFEQYMSYFVEPHTAYIAPASEKEERRVGNSNVILDEIKKRDIGTNQSNNNINAIEAIETLTDSEDEEEDFEMNQDAFQHLRSMVMAPTMNIKALDAMASGTPLCKKKRKSNKKKKQNENGMLSSFWKLRKRLSENGMNGSYHKKSFKMNGSLVL